MKLVVTWLLALSCGVCAGCGVVFVPMVQRFPEPIGGVKVVDLETGKAIPSARVSFELYRHRDDRCDAPALRDVAEVGDEADWQLDGRRDAEETFVFEPARPLVWLRWYFPFRASEGHTRYYDYDARVRASAAGYCSVLLEYPGRRPPLAGWSESAGNGKAGFDVDGVLWFHLRKLSRRTGLN